jgi:transcription antitermination factor NusG
MLSMATLGPEPMIWPESLFDQGMDGLWWVLHVKPRSEKALARRCYSREACFFLPQTRRINPRPGRGKDSYVPLFPGYFFLFGSERNRLVALETNLVVKALEVPAQQELFDDLKRLNTVMRAGLEMSPQERLPPGAAVTVVAGPLTGMQGTVIRHKNKTNLILKVSFLQQGASVEMENWMVEPITEPS